jgi:hypothetical protein
MDPTKHNYYKKLMQLHERGELPAGSLSEVDVCHDDWCAVHAGDYCNCDPDIKLRTPATRAGTLAASHQDHEEARPLEYPTAPCPHCGNAEFIIWQKPDDARCQAISCNRCGAVMSSTHPLDPEDRPRRQP